MAGRSPGRFFAPLALVVTIGGTIYVIDHGLRHDHRRGHTSARSGAGRPGSHGPRGASGPTGPSSALPSTPSFYLVRPGDSLSVIAAREHMPLAALEALNPGVNPGALQTGQRLRLRR